MPAFRRRTSSRSLRRRPSKIVRRAYRSERAFPRRQFGPAYFRRGDNDSLAMFGADRKTANVDQQSNRKRLGFVGKGGYWGNRVGDWMSGLTGIKGLGDMASGVENQVINKGVGFLNKYTGSGSYNSLVNPDGLDIAQVSQVDSDASSLVISHREYITDINGSSAFSNQSFLLNPGNSQVFPWLSQIAVNYDEYDFKQIIFGFKSVTADVTTASVQIGSVIMACNYNVNSPPFTGKIPMMEYESAVSDRITSNVTFGVECDDSKNGNAPNLYVTNALTAPVGEDPKSYFLGNMQIATNQCLNTGEIGELWVEYTVCLRKKKMFTALNGNVVSLRVGSFNYNSVTYTPTALNLFGFPGGLLTNVSLGGGSSPWPLYYSYGALSTANMRLGNWTTNTSRAFNLVWNSLTGFLTLYMPDAFTGAIQFVVTETNGANTTNGINNQSLCNSVIASNGNQTYTAASLNVTNFAIVNTTVSANAAGVGGASGGGNFISLAFGFTTLPTAFSVSIFGVNPL